MFAGPTARAIQPFTAAAGKTRQFVVNGSFTGDRLSYSAKLTSGNNLPSWASLDAASGTFTFRPPVAALGQQLDVRITARDRSGGSVSTTFRVNVDEVDFKCTVDANTDRINKVLDCKTGSVRLRGYVSSGTYKWSGPKGFSSSQQEPVVSVPGVYHLTTSGSGCPRSSVVNVLKSDCSGASNYNLIPNGRLSVTQREGTAPMTVIFDARKSYDSDGKVTFHRLSWDGGEASGPTPKITFPAGEHEVVLTVSDNTGAKSTDRLTIKSASANRQSANSLYLEAECAEVGSQWLKRGDDNASGNTYVVSKQTYTKRAPADVPGNRVRFYFGAQAGRYSLHARIYAPGNDSDSYWVRVNGGKWISWSSNIDWWKYEWYKMPSGFDLKSGSNYIDFAFREKNTRLDKIFITNAGGSPSGKGGQSLNCQTNKPPVARVKANTYYGEAPLIVRLDGGESSDDKGIVSYHWKWNGQVVQGKTGSLNLPKGNHKVTLVVADEHGATNTETVAIQAVDKVSTPPTASAPSSIISLEAECAEVGKDWAVASNTAASGGRYVASSRSSTNGVRTGSGERVRFTFQAPSSGRYDLFARIDALSDKSDSYWVRINGGKWYAWKSGIRHRQGYEWNAYPQTVNLNAGTNTIDFSFRESGTRLDKIALQRGGSMPEGRGPEASNCDGGSTVWMEAECADVGKDWTLSDNDQSSGSGFAVFKGGDQMKAPAKEDSDELIKFRPVLAKGGTYSLHFRMDASIADKNSFWVRIDGGKWINFWRAVGDKPLRNGGIAWEEVSDNGNKLRLKLSAGKHVIVVAHREAGTKLDKIMLTTSSTKPSGYGGAASNCSGSVSRGMMATTPTSSAEPLDEEIDNTTLAAEPELLVYPNPAIDFVKLELTSDYSGSVELEIIDMTGRRVRSQRLEKAGELLTDRLDVSQLPAGMYQLRLIEDDRQSIKPFVKR